MDRTKHINAGYLLLPILLFGLLSGCDDASSPARKQVSSLVELISAIDKANPGDQLVLKNGSYENTAQIHITRQGTASKPIIIEAESIGGVTFTGSSGFSLDSGAQYVIIKGFVFRHAVDSSVWIRYGADHCRFTRNVFELTGSQRGSYLKVAGDDAEIDYNTFQNKSSEGRMLLVEGPWESPIMARRVWIHHNYLYNFENSGRNNSSAIQFGRSWCSLMSAQGLIEHNLFVDSRGENENVAHKASNCVYRYNTFGPGCTELSLRHGNHNEVYGNFFFDTGGIRVFGDDHRIYSNYFEGNRRAIHLGNGRAEVADGADLKTHDRPDRVVIVHNTLVNNTQNFFMAGRKEGLGATYPVIANNIILGGGSATDFNGPTESIHWHGNIIWDTEAGDIPASGYTEIDPLLTKSGEGIYQIQKGSPVVGDNQSGVYDFVKTDIDGQTRSSTDIGADAFSEGEIINRPLTVDDVGPFAKHFIQ